MVPPTENTKVATSVRPQLPPLTPKRHHAPLPRRRLVGRRPCPEMHPHESPRADHGFGPCCDRPPDCSANPPRRCMRTMMEFALTAQRTSSHATDWRPRRVVCRRRRRAGPGPLRRGGGCFTCATTGDTRGEPASTRPISPRRASRGVSATRCPKLSGRRAVARSVPARSQSNGSTSRPTAASSTTRRTTRPSRSVVTHDGAAAPTSARAAACWTGQRRFSGTCDAQPAWAASAAPPTPPRQLRPGGRAALDATR